MCSPFTTPLDRPVGRIDAAGQCVMPGDRVTWAASDADGKRNSCLRFGTVEAVLPVYLVIRPDGARHVVRVKNLERVFRIPSGAAT